MYKGNMNDFVEKLDKWVQEQGFKGHLEYATWGKKPALIVWYQKKGFPGSGNSDYVYDTEDFEQQVYAIVKKYVKL